MRFKTSITVYAIVSLFVYTLPLPAASATLEQPDQNDAAIARFNALVPADLVVKQDPFFGRLRQFLGIRRPIILRPEIGTTITIHATAYSSSPYQTDSTPCVTAAGTRVRPGVVASNFLPLGTLLEADGEIFIVEDRMGRAGGYAMDFWFPATSRAREFGRRIIEVTVIGYGEPGQALPGRQEVSEEVNDESSKVNISSKEPLTRSRFKVIGDFLSRILGARPDYDVDQHDVDCFAEEEN